MQLYLGGAGGPIGGLVLGDRFRQTLILEFSELVKEIGLLLVGVEDISRYLQINKSLQAPGVTDGNRYEPLPT